MYQILLNKNKNKRSRNVNNILTTQIKGSKKLLPQGQLFADINEMQLYNDERQNCNLIRLNCVINPICSNVLFNTITEIVKNEGDGNLVKSLNYGLKDGYIDTQEFDNLIYCKMPDVFVYGGVVESIRDTQISSNKCGFKYHCGLDIFNNHIIRNNTFKTVCYNPTTSKIFNTIEDLMRNEDGINVGGIGFKSQKISKQHLYTSDDVDTFQSSINNKLFEKNGWFGFTNIGKFVVVDNNNEPMDIFRVINYKRSCDFIQMTPSSDLWDFAPIYNKYLHRNEKNWNYCLTYPSSSTTQNITFIRDKTNSLKIMYINDKVTLQSGVNGVKIYSISKHGLKVGDFINLYKNDEILFHSIEVKEIENDYIFYVFNPSSQIIEKRYEITSEELETYGVDVIEIPTIVDLEECHFYYKENKITVGEEFESEQQLQMNQITKKITTNEVWKTKPYHGTSYLIDFTDNPVSDDNIMKCVEDDISFEIVETIKNNRYFYTLVNPTISIPLKFIVSNDRKKIYCGDGANRRTYYTIDDRIINLDDDAQDFSFKKVVEGHEVEYYVRIFSRIPNWKGCDTKIDAHSLYHTNKNLIARYQTLDNEFENHISNLSFAKNIYGDNLSQIVYTDDIDISYLKDNLGRPLSSIYFTILKNNKGYKEWYGKNGAPIEIRTRPNDDDINYHIEYSHCFGMLNCAFRLSKESLPHIGHNNSMQINNIDSSFHFQGLDVEDIQHNMLTYEDILQDNNIVNNEEKTNTERSYRSLFNNILNDEIQYGEYVDSKSKKRYIGDTHFYGDLCEYSNQTLDENSIQQVEMRFNTAQREITTLDTSYQYFSNLYYENIISDDKDENGFIIEKKEILNAHQHKEGYCYNPHYEIPIKQFSQYVTTQTPIIMTLVKIEEVVNDFKRQIMFRIKTMNPHTLQLNDTFYMKYEEKNDESVQKNYICYVRYIINDYVFECDVYDENKKHVNVLNTLNVDNFRLFKKDSETPEYAILSNDKSCLFKWKKIINNGDVEQEGGEVYPFINGAFYINHHINLFVKRQDPNEYTLLQSGQFPMDIESAVTKENEEENNYISEKDMSC